ncbi:MAG: type I methionyl aminopeptidase [Candidatus Omnitrophota bacterium]
MISIKSQREIELMAKAGDIVGEVFERLREMIAPQVSTSELDRVAAQTIREFGGRPAFLGYRGYPATICASINEVVVHGIPGQRRLQQGDIVGVDIGVELGGYYADAAATFAVGPISSEAQRLMEVTRQSLAFGIEKARIGNRLSDIGAAVQGHVEQHGFSVVRMFVGHGIGSHLHEDPEIPNFGKANAGPRLEAGMTLAIEPMINQGDHQVEILSDGWTAVTKDRKLSAHFEHTIAVTDQGPRILTKWQRNG